MLIGIVAISKNFAIGKDGKLPWHFPADLKFFKETTTGNAVVMGASTWRSIAKPLPHRVNIVLSRSGKVEVPSEAKMMRSKDEVLDFAAKFDHDVFIIGGAKTYNEFADEIDSWIVTEVPLVIEGADTFMDRDFLNGFKETDSRDLGGDLRVKILLRR
jgi:dihydrofolate reductase